MTKKWTKAKNYRAFVHLITYQQPIDEKRYGMVVDYIPHIFIPRKPCLHRDNNLLTHIQEILMYL